MLPKILSITISLIFALSCTTKPSNDKPSKQMKLDTGFEITLAQWSLHRSFLGPKKENYWEWFNQMLRDSPDSILQGKLSPVDFPTIAAKYGVKSIELVNVFYFSKAEDRAFWISFKEKCEQSDVSVNLIMCDGLGNLADNNSLERTKAVENHYKWVDIAKLLGAQAIRVNAAGNGSKEEVAKNAIDGLKQLGKYGASKGINILVENHGGNSSDGSWLAGVMKKVAMDNVGTLPDFGNFCIEHGPDGCIESYDRYQGIAELMPFAKGVSAKSHEFDENGNEVNSDFFKIMRIVKNSGYKGKIGIEYEGDELSEDEGIIATMNLLKKVIEQL
jgi:sugar phosphate isomerase/epimerase